MKHYNIAVSALVCMASLSLTSCIGDGDETIVLESGNIYGIPADSEAGDTPSGASTSKQIPQPSFNFDSEVEGVGNVNITGVYDYTVSSWMELYGTGAGERQNIWIEIDDTPKSFTIENISNSGTRMATDLVFTVDNSGSMSDEAEAISRDILSWSQYLEQQGIDIRYGCIGYSQNGYINGAIDMCTASELSDFFTKNGSGTSRTMGFANTTLQTYAKSFPSVNDECGAMALRFADRYLSFRGGANRIYANFTDEPNQPKYNSDYSVEYFNNNSSWIGTVHTIYSDSESASGWVTLKNEKPWLISEYTGGTNIFVNSSFTNVDLKSLPVTGSLTNSYLIRLHADDYAKGSTHVMKITVRASDGTLHYKTFNLVFK